jgi:hypothetical protein
MKLEELIAKEMPETVQELPVQATEARPVPFTEADLRDARNVALHKIKTQIQLNRIYKKYAQPAEDEPKVTARHSGRESISEIAAHAVNAIWNGTR